MSFAIVTNTPTGKSAAIHYASVILVEELENGGVCIHFRAGNSCQQLYSTDSMDEILRVLKGAKQADINLYDPD